MSEQNEKPYDVDTVRDGVQMQGWLTSRSVRIAACVLISQLIMTGITWAYMKSTTPEIVVFDMKGTIDLFIQQSAQLQLDEGKAKVLTARFNAAMSSSLDEWQKSHNAIILVKPAAVSSLPDITSDIRSDIARRTQEGR
ncbi:type-F conjugative transfer system protein TrbI [Salmonella enterica]|nr:type-F conjugative transfer system protein TrbI [Salmonella enterica subsp. enterica serovar Gaminara]EKN9262527.1 type-F conjugative transfer system protein TrbI [Salmonella enterica]ELM5086907.1 type-F conjugative transfer system protein TrbI [Salmonella enterica]